MMQSRAFLSYTTLLLTACAGSQAPDASEVAPSEVSALPSGSAAGVGYSGSYLVGAGEEEWCRCRLGESEDICGTARLTSGAVLAVEQTEGALVFSAGDSTWRGGVNLDGTFNVGAVTPVTDTTGREVGYMAAGIDGEFSAESPTTLDALLRATVVYTTSSGSYDCDIGFSFTALRR